MTQDDRVQGASGGAGTIVTFYSYKGGTGRTMALANVAWILASNNHRVLVVDWDLESPGLHKYFRPFLRDPDLRDSRGVIDMVRDYADATMRPLESSADPDWIASHADVLRFAVSLTWRFSHPAEQSADGAGCVDLLPAGRQSAGYTAAVSTFDWHTFYDRLGGHAFVKALIESMRANYDYILIDSRTGVSDGAGICTTLLPDTVVVSFTLNEQSIEGAAAVARSIQRRRGERPVRLLPVPMRVEDAEQLKLEAGRDRARSRFAGLLPVMTPEQVDGYWGDVEVPYKPFYAYEEILAVFGDRPKQESTLLSAYERLTQHLTQGQVESLVPIDERRRRRWLPAFERHRTVSDDTALISYAAADRMWAEWVKDVLSASGLDCELREISFARPATSDGGEELTEAGHVVVILSYDYMHSAGSASLWQQAARNDPTGSRFLVPVRVDSTAVLPPFVNRLPIDLSGLSEAQATELLVEAFDSPRTMGLDAPGLNPATRRELRFPTSEPPVWGVPQRNVMFTGRRAVLEDIRNRLSGSDGGPVGLFGLGGSGKSQIALEYAHRFRASYDAVWWISAGQASVVRSSLATLAGELGVATSDNAEDRMNAALDALRQGDPHTRWLIIFDGANEPSALRPYLPQGQGHVLLTTLDHSWARDADMIEVTAFERTESMELLKRRAPRLTDAEADEIAERLGDLPLAIEQAAAWLAATGQPASLYLQRLSDHVQEMLGRDLPEEYLRSGAQPWLVSLQSLRERSPAAARLLELCAFFAPEPIPMQLVYTDRLLSVLRPFDQSLRDPLLVGRLIREIGRYALARLDTSRPPRVGSTLGGDQADEATQTSLQMHALVQSVVRASLTPEGAAETRMHVHAILAAANPKDPDQPQNWNTYASLWPHIIPSHTVASGDPDVRQMLLDVARYLWKRADYTTCMELTAHAIEAWREREGEDAPSTLLMRFHMANALRLQARYKEAFEIDEDVVDRLRRTLGEDHEYAVIAAGSLAADMRALGDFRGARDLDERTEALARTVFGEDHPRALIAAHNLAISLKLVGDLHGALRLNEATLTRRRSALGELHPHSLYSAGQFGRDLRDGGYLRRSERVLETALDGLRRVVGDGAPETLRAMKNLAVTLRKLGAFDRSYALSLDALERSAVLHGRDHPDVQACAMNLACDESALERDADALTRAEPVFRWYRDHMGEDHLFSLAYGNNLAIFLRKSGHADAAYDQVRYIVERFADGVGPDHPYTLAANVNLANCYFDRTEIALALDLDRETYDRSQRILGPEHPDTLAVANNLATSLVSVGDNRAARALRVSVLPLFRRVLGDTHPNTISLVANNRLNCDLEPPPT